MSNQQRHSTVLASEAVSSVLDLLPTDQNRFLLEKIDDTCHTTVRTFTQNEHKTNNQELFEAFGICALLLVNLQEWTRVLFTIKLRLQLLCCFWTGILFELLNKVVIASRMREIVATKNSSSY